GSENETRSIGAHGIHQLLVCCDITPETAERFSQRALDHVNAGGGLVAIANAAAPRSVHADRVHFIAVGHGAVTLGEVADCVYRRNITVHGIEGFEHNQFWACRLCSFEQFFEMTEIIVTPDLLFAAGLPHAFDH